MSRAPAEKPLRTLYKNNKAPFARHEIKVGDGHTLNIREYGNPDGIPVMVHHGGPGGGCPDFYADYFGPQYRVILYDQRGAGLSTPTASLYKNTTEELIRDAETIRRTLELGRVAVFGGSWGATLSLLYAQAYPKKVTALFLRGIFLGRPQDMRAYLMEECQAAKVNKNEWIRFKEHVFPGEGHKPKDFRAIMDAYAAKAANEDPAVWQPAALAFARWEIVNCYQDPKLLAAALATVDPKMPSQNALNIGRIEIHYMSQECFMGSEDRIMNALGRLPKVPIYITTGRQDTICPPYQTRDIVAALETLGHKNVTSVYPENTGHSCEDPGNKDALVRFTKDCARRLAAHPSDAALLGAHGVMAQKNDGAEKKTDKDEKKQKYTN